MVIDLIEIKPKKRKILTLLICILVGIIVLTILGITVFKRYNSKQITKTEGTQEKFKQEEIENVIEEPIEEKPKFEFTQKGKENLLNIYESEEKRVFLTIDDGPSTSITPLFLEYLKQEQIKANFFVLGSRAEFYPQIVKQIYDEGHFIGNHGYSHIYEQIYTSPQAVLDEFNQAETCIRNALENQEFNSRIFRFPGGSNGGKYHNVKQEAINLLSQNNIGYIDWNALTNDTMGNKTPESMIEYLSYTAEGKNSIVVLIHDKMITYDALPNIIGFLRENGYEFKTFYDILDN